MEINVPRDIAELAPRPWDANEMRFQVDSLRAVWIVGGGRMGREDSHGLMIRGRFAHAVL
jgi:hypothetical protein